MIFVILINGDGIVCILFSNYFRVIVKSTDYRVFGEKFGIDRTKRVLLFECYVRRKDLTFDIYVKVIVTNKQTKLLLGSNL